MKSIIEIATGKLIGVTPLNECLETETLIDELLTVSIVKPYFNFNTREFYEGATQQEIDEYNLQFVPSEVSLWKLRAVLKLMNLESSVETAINNLSEPNKTMALYIWNYGSGIDRYSPTTLFIQSVLQMTDEQVNDIFIQANQITL